MSVYTWSEIVLAVAFCAAVALITVICIRCQRNARARVEAKSSDTEKASIRSSADSGDEQQHYKEEAEVINELPASVDRTEIHGNKETTDIQTDPINDSVKPLKTQMDGSVGVSKWTDSVISDGVELLPPVCGSLDQLRKSYAYICTYPRVRPSSAAAEAGIGSDSLKSDVFFDAASSNSGELGTLAKWILDIQKMSAGSAGKEIAKSYDASSEDSFTTAVETSEETDEEWDLRPVNEKPPKKRRVSRKARSLHLASSHNKNMRDKTKKNATWGTSKQIQEGAPCSSSSAGYKSGSSHDLEVEASCETEHEPSADYDPIYKNYSGIISEARRQDAYENYPEETEPLTGTESLQEREDPSTPFVSSLVLRDGIFVRSGSSSSIGISPPPRSGSCRDILLREPGVDGAKRKPPLKPARHLSHSISPRGAQPPTVVVSP
ncbi:uncharacterized protein LOC124276351 [Haliotis rubra]|uniref:uncharacterized protein LOC124276351 n=1 Tax=Haliotis rubra TaxID=36100 RepID=UPI001EE5BF35|nr:uncharacterized protein LOC124276351 [Haliotis rubra]